MQIAKHDKQSIFEFLTELSQLLIKLLAYLSLLENIFYIWLSNLEKQTKVSDLKIIIFFRLDVKQKALKLLF